MRKKEELFDIVRGMEYTDAVAAVSSAINAQTLSGTGRGGRLLITIILIILLFFLSVCRAHVVRVATKTKSEGRFYFFRFFSFS